jgi:hypothetical protein
LAEAESTVENLSIVLAGLNIEISETIERVSILARQLKEISLFLIIVREEEIIMALKSECTICRLTTLKIRDESTQMMEITC